jgi:hypothetical protein
MSEDVVRVQSGVNSPRVISLCAQLTFRKPFGVRPFSPLTGMSHVMSQSLLIA